MRILALSDLHAWRPWFQWTLEKAMNFDAVVFAGDFLNQFAPDVNGQAEFVREWLIGFPRPIYCCTGNHDFTHSFLAAAASKNSFVRVDDTNEPLSHDLRVVCVPFGKIPRQIIGIEHPTLLVSHSPPAETPIAVGYTDEDLGDTDVLALVRTLPRGSILVSGHVHEPKKHFSRVGKTLCLNSGLAAADGGPPNHSIIDTEKRTVHIMVNSVPIVASFDSST